MIDDDLIGQRIKVARKLVGYTQGQLATEMGFSTSTISDIERGRRSVAGRELHALAELLSQPLDFFLTPPETGSPSFRYLLREASERGVDEGILHRFEQLCSDYALLEKLTQAPPLPKPPDYSGFGFRSLMDADRLAQMERARLGLGDGPVPDITDLLDEKGGTRIFHVPMASDGVSGAAACDGAGWACVLVNAGEESYRRNFTIAHEYGHCLVHLRPSRDEPTGFAAHIDTRNPEHHFLARNERERFANAFAASLLMPSRRVKELHDRLVRLPGRFTDDMLYLMATYFDVSHVAIGWRLVTLRRINRREWTEYLQMGYTRPFVARRLGYEEERRKPAKLRLPPRYKYLAWKAFSDEEISLSRLAELLGENVFALKAELREREGTSKYEFASKHSTG